MKHIKELEECFINAVKENKNYVGVLVEMQGFEAPELIINGRANFETKLAYYLKAYNEDLTLKTFNGIRILACNSGYSLDELNTKISRDYRRVTNA